ncbi:MAG: transcriptional regulator [Bacillota bacterium]|nr:transcriptional regulator [Bacillota bacterium]
MAKVIGSKLRTLHIMQYLMEKSDEDNKVTSGELKDMLKDMGISADRKSIYADISTLQEWGMDIIYSKENPPGYYVATREFELPELKLLVDAVQSSKFITHKKSQELIKKLEKLTSESQARQLQKSVFVANRIKTDNEQIFYNVDTIYEAINNDSQIEFIYHEWNVDKQLVPKRGGEPYVVSPWALTWDDENYYLIAYDGKAERTKHYRVDKMKKISFNGKAREGREIFDSFDMPCYAKQTFGMFGGEKTEVILECSNHLIGAILDRFGTNNIIVPLNDDKFSIRQEVNVSGQFYGWLVGLGPDVRLVHPPEIVQEFKNKINEINARYE